MKRAVILLLFFTILSFTGCKNEVIADDTNEVSESEPIVIEDEDSQTYSELIMTANGDGYSFLFRGVIINETNDYFDVVTAKHAVLLDNRPILWIKDKSVDGEVIYYSVNHDFAIVRVYIDANDGFLGVCACEFADTYPNYSDSVWYLTTKNDRTKDAEDTKKDCYISEPSIYFDEIYETTIMFEAKIYEGQSGGGLYDADDKLLGIIIAKDDNYGLAIPVDVIIDEYKSNMEDK